MNVTFGLPASSLGLSLLAKVTANPEQAQEHRPIPPCCLLTMPRGASLWRNTAPLTKLFLQRAEKAGIFLMKPQPCGSTSTEFQASKHGD